MADRRSALQEQVRGRGRPPGVLAYSGDEAVGWCQVGPKTGYARMARSQIASPAKGEPEPPDLWSVTCLVVPVGWRRQGLGSALLDGAVEHARRHGAAALEGYPVDTAGERRSSSDLYHGTVSMFADAGFAEVRRPKPTRAVMRLTLR